MSRDDLLQFNVILVPFKKNYFWLISTQIFFWELSMDVMIPFEWNQWVLSSPEIAFSSIIESPFMEPFLCMNITTIPLNINTNIRISSRFFLSIKKLYLANQSSFQNLNLNIVHIHSNHQSFNRNTSKAPALSDAQGTSTPAYFFNPDRYAPDCVPRVLSGTSWFLRLWCCSRWFQIYTF